MTDFTASIRAMVPLGVHLRIVPPAGGKEISGYFFAGDELAAHDRRVAAAVLRDAAATMQPNPAGADAVDYLNRCATDFERDNDRA